MDDNLDSLVQKVVDVIKVFEDLNILVRRLPNSSDALAAINERIDTTQFAVQGTEKSIGVIVSEIQNLRTGMESVHTAIEGDNKAIVDMQTVIHGLPEKLVISLERVGGLKKEMDDLSQRLAIPLEQRVTHHHHVTKAVWVCIFLICVVGGLTTLLVYAWGRSEREKENDIKYRSLRLSTDARVERSVMLVDSSYLADPAGFRKATIEEEDRQERMDRERREADRKKEEWQRSEEKVRGVEKRF